MKKLYKNNFTVLLSTLAVSSALLSCTPVKNNNIETAEIKAEITKDYQKEKQTNNGIKENNDKEIEEYIGNLKKEAEELSKISKEKWESEEVQEKVNAVKKKIKDLFDFVFNGKEINGITFKDLSDEGKENAKKSLEELDYYIELLIPNYKERFHDWTVDKGADALETYDELKNWYNNYKEETLEEYNKRKVR